MIKRTLTFLPMIAFAAVILSGCGGSSHPKGDGDVAVDDVSTPDEVQPDHPGDTPAEEVPHETQDPPADQADAQEDPAGDIPGEEIAPDVEPDAADIVEEDALGPCQPLTGTIEGIYSWTLVWMGTGTIATFSLNLANENVAGDPCNFSDITAVEATLRRASDDSLIITYDTVGPTGAMDTTLAPGESSATDFRADYSLSTPDECDSGVIVEVSIEYMIEGVAAPPIKIDSAPTNHMCVE